MGKFSELDMAIKDLRTVAATINEVANTLEEMFGGKPETEEPQISLEEVRAFLANKSRGNRTAEVRALLQKYGASKLSQIDPANYKALLADAALIPDPEVPTDAD